MNSNEIRILVVEDDCDIARGTSRVLEQAGYTTVIALTGSEALASLSASRPDLVLLDRDLPDTDGMELCRQIKSDPALADIFVILISGTYTRTEIKAVITDMMMPGMDGPNLVRTLRHMDARLPIIGVTGLIEQRGIKGLSEQYLTGLLLKPFTRVELLAALSKALARSRPESESPEPNQGEKPKPQ